MNLFFLKSLGNAQWPWLLSEGFEEDLRWKIYTTSRLNLDSGPRLHHLNQHPFQNSTTLSEGRSVYIPFISEIIHVGEILMSTIDYE